MKTFREHLKEEVMPSAFAADGSIDIEKDAVRDNINGLLSYAVSCPDLYTVTSSVVVSTFNSPICNLDVGLEELLTVKLTEEGIPCLILTFWNDAVFVAKSVVDVNASVVTNM